MEVFLRNAVMLLKERKDSVFDRFLLLLFERETADENIELLPLDDLRCLLLELFLRQMDEQIGHAEDGIICLLSDRNLDDRTILFHDYAVQGKRNRHPLIFLDAAVVMCVEIGKAAVLIERILLNIQATRIDVGAEDVHAAFNRRLANMKENNRLLHIDGIDLIAGLQRKPLCDDVREIAVPRSLRKAHRLGHALALRLAVREEIDVSLRKFVHCGAFFGRIFRPD